MTSGARSLLDSLRIEARPAAESLVLCLEALLGACGRQVDHDELAVATGTALMTSYAPRAAPAQRWNVHGRHAFLVQAARLYGLDLRDLHPPSAAPVPPPPREFDLHFRDSYLPFVEAALRRGEPVLAWMGWPEPCASEWGLITEIDPAARRCAGLTRASAGAIVALAGPPIQAYTIQAYVPRADEPRTQLEHLLSLASVILENRIDPSYGVLTGPAALRVLVEKIEGSTPQDEPETLPAASIAEVFRAYVEGRRRVAHFLQKRLDRLPDEVRALAGDMAAVLHRASDSLAPWLGVQAIESARSSSQGRRLLASIIERIASDEECAAGSLRDR